MTAGRRLSDCRKQKERIRKRYYRAKSETPWVDVKVTESAEVFRSQGFRQINHTSLPLFLSSSALVQMLRNEHRDMLRDTVCLLTSKW